MTPTRPQQQGNFQPPEGRLSRPPFGSPGEGTSGGLQTGNSPGGPVLTDSPNTNTFVLPNGTVVPWNTAFGQSPPPGWNFVRPPQLGPLSGPRSPWGTQPRNWGAPTPPHPPAAILGGAPGPTPTLPYQFISQPQIPAFGQPPHPGWAGYLQWLHMMRPQPGIPGGVPGPTRG